MLEGRGGGVLIMKSTVFYKPSDIRYFFPCSDYLHEILAPNSEFPPKVRPVKLKSMPLRKKLKIMFVKPGGTGKVPMKK